MLFSRIHDRVSRCQIRLSPSLPLPKSFGVFFILFLFPVLITAAQPTSAYELGVEAYVHNRPAEAAGYFESALDSGNTKAETYLYLGIVYEQMGLYGRAIEILDQAKNRFPNFAAQVYFNQGNIYLAQGMKEESIASYSQAISQQRSYSAPYLNRANIFVSIGQLEPALSDYRLFLQFDSSSPLAPQVRQMIAAIESEFAAREAAELAQQAEERIREIERQAETERQQGRPRPRLGRLKARPKRQKIVDEIC